MVRAFSAPEQLAFLETCDDDALSQLPFGVVAMTPAGIVTRYNAYESTRSGLSAAQVIGRHFFREIAQCINNPKVAGRFAAPPSGAEPPQGASLDVCLLYVMTFYMKPRPVELRLLRGPAAVHHYLLLQDR